MRIIRLRFGTEIQPSRCRGCSVLETPFEALHNTTRGNRLSLSLGTQCFFRNS